MYGKVLVRFSIVVLAVYFLASSVFAQFFGVDIVSDWYTSLLLLIVVVYCYSEGKYHCKYLKYTALGIFLSDTIVRLDNTFDFLSIDAHNLIAICLVVIGVATSITKAIIHFVQVTKLRNERERRTN